MLLHLLTVLLLQAAQPLGPVDGRELPGADLERIQVGMPAPDFALEDSEGEVHRLSGVGVATSGDRYQYLEAGGARYSHIIDPRTGRPISSQKANWTTHPNNPMRKG